MKELLKKTTRTAAKRARAVIRSLVNTLVGKAEAMSRKAMKKASALKDRVLESKWTEFAMVLLVVTALAALVKAVAFVMAHTFGKVLTLLGWNQWQHIVMLVFLIYATAFYILNKGLKAGMKHENDRNRLVRVYAKVSGCYVSTLKGMGEQLEGVTKTAPYNLAPGCVKMAVKFLVDALKK